MYGWREAIYDQRIRSRQRHLVKYNAARNAVYFLRANIIFVFARRKEANKQNN